MNDGYRVVKDNLGQWFIVCDQNQNAIGLTWRDGATLNGQENDFYVKSMDIVLFFDLILEVSPKNTYAEYIDAVQEIARTAIKQARR